MAFDPLKKEQRKFGFYVSYKLWLPLLDCDTLADYTQNISGVREGERGDENKWEKIETGGRKNMAENE